VIKTFEPEGYSLEFTYDDMTPLEKVVITPKDKKPPFVYYYIKVVQKDGHTAWSSPIWVDLLPPQPSNRSALRKQKSSASKKAVIESFDDDEDEEDDFDDDFEE